SRARARCLRFRSLSNFRRSCSVLAMRGKMAVTLARDKSQRTRPDLETKHPSISTKERGREAKATGDTRKRLDPTGWPKFPAWLTNAGRGGSRAGDEEPLPSRLLLLSQSSHLTPLVRQRRGAAPSSARSAAAPF